MASKYLIEGPVTSVEISVYLDGMAAAKDTGGHSFFLGQVRADFLKGKIVMAIEYSAYESMVNTEADKIVESVTSEFDDVRSVRIIHSTGVVRAGEVSLAVMVSAGHRQQAMQACSKTVELIKERLPVWKKEIYEDNSHAWRENQ
ncbi:MAG TPA: molybdenum cofactor biosynthesis protein MoaE [Bacteroidales bacterium]|nr:molybdenum cofactor biosynthesis protein MoaE [Bacteroidales bacterium]